MIKSLIDLTQVVSDSGRLLVQGKGEPAWNMAVDEALLQTAQEPILRFYGWNVPAVSLGYFQSWKLVPTNRPFVRRHTGGGLVDHASDLTYSIVAPRSSILGRLSTADCYALIHRALNQTLHQIGLPARLTESCSESEATGCFQKPVKFDVLLQDRKVAGAAQRRTRHGLLHQGSVLLDDPALYSMVIQLLPSHLTNECGIVWQPTELTSDEVNLAHDLERSRYSQPSWNQEV